MRAMTIKEAKAHLNELVEAATQGEQVVLMRGSKHVAAIVPISTAELELPTRLTDAQAERYLARLARERASGHMLEFATVEKAAAFLTAPRKSGGRKSRAG